jgi:hypothetical protein
MVVHMLSGFDEGRQQQHQSQQQQQHDVCWETSLLAAVLLMDDPHLSTVSCKA